MFWISRTVFFIYKYDIIKLTEASVTTIDFARQRGKSKARKRSKEAKKKYTF